MRITQPSSPRSDYLDRNPSVVRFGFDGNPPAGAVTEHWTYTVPAGRRAMVLGLQLAAVVVVALAAGQTYSAEVDLTDPAAATNRWGGFNFQAAAAIGTRETVAFGQAFLAAGWTIRFRSNQSAGAGTVAVKCGVAILEYDA